MACASMNVAVVHYHLRPGGVTSVIESTVQALQNHTDVRCVVLCGAPYRGNDLADVRVVPGLDYDREGDSTDPTTLAKAMEEAATAAFGARPDLWHVHNHSLGKNGHLPAALEHLRQQGHRFLLQIHDFAEDGRPENYRVLQETKTPYIMGIGVHYATINGRDQSLLEKAGIPRNRVHALPNPINATWVSGPAADRERLLLLYPTRGIRRKNLGEAVLLALLCQGRAEVATTRGPDNPIWQPCHDEWRAFAQARPLPITFAVVDRVSAPAQKEASLNAWLRACHGFLTTSVAEGFGLAYLESLNGQWPLIGRDLPEITRDFKELELPFPGLYRSIGVPLEWVGEERVMAALREALETYYQSYDRPLPECAAERALETMVDDRGRVDFGCLREEWQREVIDRLLDGEDRSHVVFKTEAAIADADLWMESWLDYGRRLTSKGADRQLAAFYGPEPAANRCLQAYRAVVGEADSEDEAPQPCAVSDALLDVFLSPERFHFLRT